jgi:hypothetical protein
MSVTALMNGANPHPDKYLYTWSDAITLFNGCGGSATANAFKVQTNVLFCHGLNVNFDKLYVASSTGTPDIQVFWSSEKL